MSIPKLFTGTEQPFDISTISSPSGDDKEPFVQEHSLSSKALMTGQKDTNVSSVTPKSHRRESKGALLSPGRRNPPRGQYAPRLTFPSNLICSALSPRSYNMRELSKASMVRKEERNVD